MLCLESLCPQTQQKKLELLCLQKQQQQQNVVAMPPDSKINKMESLCLQTQQKNWSCYASRNSNNNKMWSLCLQTAKIKWSHYASRHGNKTKPNDNKNSMTTTHLATCSSGKFRFPFFLYTPSMVRASMWNRWKRPWLPEGAPDACDHIICSMVRSVCWNPSHDSWSWWSR